MAKKQDIKKQNTGLQQRLAAVGQQVKRGSVTALKGVGAAARPVLRALTKPASAVGGALTYGLDKDSRTTARQGLREGWRNPQLWGTEFSRNVLGVRGGNKQAAVATAFDLVSDPVSYVGFGAGKFGKGALTGKAATLDKAGRRAYANLARSQKFIDTEEQLRRRLGAASRYDIQSKLNEYMQQRGLAPISQYEAVQHLAFGETGRAAGIRQGLREARKYGQVSEKLAGPGLHVGGKSLITGAEMQNAGAAVNRALRAAPFVGKPFSAISDAAARTFRTGYNPSLSLGQQQVWKEIIGRGAGEENVRNTTLARQIGAMDVLGDTPVQVRGAYAGTSRLRDELDAMLSRPNPYTHDLNQPLRSDAAGRQAMRDLGLPENATLGDFRQYVKNELGRVYAEEAGAGLLRGRRENYFPHVRALRHDSAVARGTISRHANIQNMFSQRRRVDFEDLTAREINDRLLDELDNPRSHRRNMVPDFDNPHLRYLEEDGIRAFGMRMAQHNRLMADSTVLRNMLDTFGERVATPQVMRERIMQGYDVVVPRMEMHAISVQGLGTATRQRIAAEVGEDALGPELLSILTGGPLTRINARQGELLLARTHNAVMYAIPKGLADQFNRSTAAQLRNSWNGFVTLLDRFNSGWKPLVTGLRTQFHFRNIASSSFNNFMAIGADLFNPKVQAAAAKMAAFATGRSRDFTINLGKGRSIKASRLYEAMQRRGVIGQFSTNEFTSMLGGIEGVMRQVGATNPASRAWQTVTGAAKGVSNVVETDVRAATVLAALRRGESMDFACELSKKFHFDYQDLTNTEKAIKRVVPFYTWFRKNFPLQLEQLLDNPRYLLAVNKAVQNAYEAQGMTEDDYAQLPDYLREQGALVYGRTADGRYRVADLGLPVSDLYTSGTDIVNMMSPFLKVPLEVATNHSAFKQGPLYVSPNEAAYRFASGQSPRDKAVRAIPGATTWLYGHPTAAKVADQAFQSTGVLANINKYLTPQGDTTSVVEHAYQQAPNVPAQLWRGLTATGYRKVYNPAIGERNVDYAYNRALQDAIKEAKEYYGLDVPDRRRKASRP